MNKKELNLYNGRILVPFHASSTLGDYFTIDPEITVYDKQLSDEISRVIEKPFNTNGIFRLGQPLNCYLGCSSYNDWFESFENCKIYGPGYQLRIYRKDDLNWVVPWYKKYIKEIGEGLITIFSDNLDYYTFCKSAFLNWISIKEEYGSLSIEEQMRTGKKYIGLEYHALITSIYLGLLNGYPNIDNFVESTLDHYKNGGVRFTDPIFKIKEFLSL